MKKYLASIDGLRGLAVLVVILFHSLPSYFPGGFIGVDVFFVISGFVITYKITGEIKDSRFSIVGFYSDRIKRLVPLYALVAYTTSVAAVFFLTPQELISFGKALLSASTFVSNLYYWRTLDYFEAGQTSNPLLHTWSLSVEWQFYFLFPLAFSLVYRHARGRLILLMVIAIVLSATISELALARHQSFSFYLLPTRMFELLIGAIIAVAYSANGLPRNSSVMFQPIFSTLTLWIGLVGLAFQVATNAFGSPFPGVNAFVVAILSSAILIGLLSQNATGEKLFTNTLFKHLGFISYGLYLWHYPLLELTRLISFEGLSPSIFWIVYATALLAVAELSGQLIERPIWRMKTSARLTLTILGIGILPTLLIYSYIQETNGNRKGFIENLVDQERGNFVAIEQFATANHLKYPVVGNCRALSDYSQDFAKKILDCTDYRRTILIIGDSHAINLYNGLARLTELEGKFNIMAIASGGCAVGNMVRNCDLSGVFDFVNKNKNRFYRILYTEAGFRQFKNMHGQQAERRDFVSQFSIKSLKPVSEKVEDIARWLVKIDAAEQIWWIGPWPEPQIYLNGIVGIRNLTEMNNDRTFGAYKKLSIIYSGIASIKEEKIQYIDLLPMFSGTDSGILVLDCLRFSDKDHLSTCGEDYLAKKLAAKILENSYLNE